MKYRVDFESIGKIKYLNSLIIFLKEFITIKILVALISVIVGIYFVKKAK